MKIVHLSTYDIQGGAARAAYRLHEGLMQTGQNSLMITRYKVSADASVVPIQIAPSPAENGLALIQTHAIHQNRSSRSNTLFSLGYPGWDVSQLEIVQAADVIHLHWVAGFQSPITVQQLLNLGKPVVWTLHDMWAFTGGCHYSAGCQGYQTDCVSCLQLVQDIHHLPAAILQDRLDLLSQAENLAIVTPSQWLADCVRQSRLWKDLDDCRLRVIPYSLDTNIFTPLSKIVAKQAIDISPDTITLLFGAETATEQRKGFAEMMQAMHYCLEERRFRELVSNGKLKILCFGEPSDLMTALNLPVQSFGIVKSDAQLSRIYAAADLFILPSLEDNLPNTMLEALSCGTPVVAFRTGGIPDLIRDRVTGRLAAVGDARSLSEVMLDSIFDPDQRQQMGQRARQMMEKSHTLPQQAQQYVDFYQELLSYGSGSYSERMGQNSTEQDSTQQNTAILQTRTGRAFAEIFPLLELEVLKSDHQFAKQQLQELTQIAEERMQLINTLHQTADERLHLIEQLAHTAAERLTLIEKLSQANQMSAQQKQQQRTRSQQKIIQLQQTLQQLKTKVAQLEQENQRLASGKGALQTIWQAVLRKLG